MSQFPVTLVIRHKKENLKKCSLRGLENRSDFTFLTYPLKTLPDLSHYVLLTIDAPPLTEADASSGLLLLDATWRYAQKMEAKLPFPFSLSKRSLPSVLKTAYPRRQNDCPSPDQGLASIEALYAAYHVLKRDTEGLLDLYYWADPFLKTNHSFFQT